MRAAISVIMPCYNAAAFLEQAVDSALSQQDVEVELIAVDDGSQDDTPQILERLQQRHGGRMQTFSQANKGPYPARNLGLRHARHELVAFLDSDDYWAPDCLKKLAAALEDPQVELAYCGWQNVGREGPGGEPYLPPGYEQQPLPAQFLRGCPWPIHAALTRRRLLQRANGFRECYRTAMDYDLWLRLSALTQHIVQVPEVLAFYRWHDQGQISNVRWEQTLDAWNVRRDFIRAQPDIAATISRDVRRKMVHGFLHDAAFDAYWKRDLFSAQRLLRRLLWTGYWRPGELKYLALSLLPSALFKQLLDH